MDEIAGEVTMPCEEFPAIVTDPDKTTSSENFQHECQEIVTGNQGNKTIPCYGASTDTGYPTEGAGKSNEVIYFNDHKYEKGIMC